MLKILSVCVVGAALAGCAPRTIGEKCRAENPASDQQVTVSLLFGAVGGAVVSAQDTDRRQKVAECVARKKAEKTAAAQ